MTLQRVVVTWLEMTSPDQLCPASPVPSSELSIAAEPADPEHSRQLYRAVGDRWFWHERLSWSAADWAGWLREADIDTWVARHGSELAGYFQLARNRDEVEIAYLGLLEAFLGRGWGGWLLTRAVQEAWNRGASRVWLHTCTLDHPAALANYRARGFRQYAVHREERAIRA